MAELCNIDKNQIITIDNNEVDSCKIEIDGKPVYFSPDIFEGLAGAPDVFNGFNESENAQINEEREKQQAFIDKITRCKDQTDDVIKEIDEIRERYTNVRIAKWRLIELKDNSAPAFMYHKRRFDKYSELIQIFTEHYNKRNDKQVEIDSKQTQLDTFLEYYNDLTNPSQSDQNTYNQLNQDLSSLNNEMVIIITNYVDDLKNLVYHLETIDVDLLLNTSISVLSQSIADYAIELSTYSNEYSSALQTTFNDFFNNVFNTLNEVNIFSTTILIKNAEDIIENDEIIDKSFIIPSESAEFYFQPIEQEVELTGTLYSQYYDLLSDPIQNLFTLEERGLATSPSQIDPYFGSGPRYEINPSDMAKFVYNDQTYYIHNKVIFDEFFSNFPDKLEAKIQWLRDNTVQSMLDDISLRYVALAEKEARYYVSKALVNNFQMEDMISRSEEAVIMYNNLNAEIQRLTELENELKEQLSQDSVTEKLQNDVECVEFIPGNQTPPDDNGGNLTDSFGKFDEDTGTITNLQDPTKPGPNKNCYWNKFAELATLYGLLPFPDPLPTAPGIGMRYWPVGLMIPTPAGLVKIPLPMIWLPLFVLSSPFGTAVLFLNVCGIFPSPMLFYIGNQGSKKFILTLRGPSSEVGCSAKFGGVTSNLLKPLALSADIDMQIAGAELSAPESIEDYKSEIINDILQKIDGWGTPELNSVNELKTQVGDDGNVDLGEVSRAVKDDIVAFLGNVTLPNIRIPKDNGKTKPKDDFSKVLDIMTQFSSEKFKLPALDVLDLRETMKLKAIDLYEDPELNDMANNMPVLDLTTNEGHEKFKAFAAKFFGILTDVLTQGTFIASIAAFIASFKLDMFICQEAIVVPNSTDLPALVIKAHMASVTSAMLENLTQADLIQMLGFSKLEPNQLFSAALNMISKFIPPIPMPPADFDVNFTLLFKSIALSLIATMIPKLTLPTGLPDHIDINLNEYMAGITNIVDKTLERFVNILPSGSYGDSREFLFGITSIDMKMLLNYVIGTQIDPIIDPILTIVQGFMSIPSFRGFEINQLDIVMDPMSVWSKFQEMQGEDMDLGKHIPLSSPDLVSIAMMLLKNLELIPWPVIGALAAFGNSEIIRNLHPVLRCDDIPPWERLTLDNILFTVFLDDFCHTGKTKGGFQENFLP